MPRFQDDHEAKAEVKPSHADALAAKKADDVTTFRTNITIAVLVLTVVLIAVIATNSGSNKPITRPRAIVFLLDGASGSDVVRAMATHRAPYLNLLSDLGTSSKSSMNSEVGLSQAKFLREVFGGNYGDDTVLKTATQSGYFVAMVGGYPLIDEAAEGCGALSYECTATCQTLVGTGNRCNYRIGVPQASIPLFINSTMDAFNKDGAHVAVVRLPIDSSANNFVSDNSIYTADAVIGRTVKALLQQTASSNTNLLVAVAASRTGVASTFVGASTFNAEGSLALIPAKSPPVLRDVASTLSKWLDLGKNLTSTPVGICSAGSAAGNCTQG